MNIYSSKLLQLSRPVRLSCSQTSKHRFSHVDSHISVESCFFLTVAANCLHLSNPMVN